MCTKYTTCGYRHQPKWKVSKVKRNHKGQYDRDRRLATAFIVIVGIVGLSMIGVNTIVSWAKSLEKVFVVENTYAEQVITITWQDEVISILKDYGVDVEYASKIITCESRWKPEAVNVNKDGSIDRGIWQINSKYHPEVSKTCAEDTSCSTIEAIRIIKTRGFNEWSCDRLIK